MASEKLTASLRAIARELQTLAAEMEDMTFTASEVAMAWPLAAAVEDDGTVSLWCEKEDCPLDGHSSQINTDTQYFTVTQLLVDLIHHIERSGEMSE